MSIKRVLCAEDNYSNLVLLSRIIDADNHVLLSARDGVEALELAEQERPDLILLDINIPNIDGLEVTRRLKADPQLANIPIIATTANVLVGDRERCLEAGCDAYLPKPLDIRELQRLVRYYLNGEDTQPAANAP